MERDLPVQSRSSSPSAPATSGAPFEVVLWGGVLALVAWKIDPTAVGSRFSLLATWGMAYFLLRPYHLELELALFTGLIGLTQVTMAGALGARGWLLAAFWVREFLSFLVLYLGDLFTGARPWKRRLRSVFLALWMVRVGSYFALVWLPHLEFPRPHFFPALLSQTLCLASFVAVFAWAVPSRHSPPRGEGDEAGERLPPPTSHRISVDPRGAYELEGIELGLGAHRVDFGGEEEPDTVPDQLPREDADLRSGSSPRTDEE